MKTDSRNVLSPTDRQTDRQRKQTWRLYKISRLQVINFSKLLYHIPLAVYTSSSILLFLYPFDLPLFFLSFSLSFCFLRVLCYLIRLICSGLHKATRSLKIKL